MNTAQFLNYSYAVPFRPHRSGSLTLRIQGIVSNLYHLHSTQDFVTGLKGCVYAAVCFSEGPLHITEWQTNAYELFPVSV